MIQWLLESDVNETETQNRRNFNGCYVSRKENQESSPQLYIRVTMIEDSNENSDSETAFNAFPAISRKLIMFCAT